VAFKYFFTIFPQRIHVHEKSILFFLLKRLVGASNIVQQGSPTQPDIIRIRANIIDFQRMIKLFLWV
jgi:hypothetical protein